jgi:FlaA1/EpsC-like NDP-sugar epimerase
MSSVWKDNLSIPIIMNFLFTRPLRNRYLFASDLILLSVAAYLSFVLRLEKLDLRVSWPGFLLFAALALIITPYVFHRAGVYSRYWRYASVDELLLLAGAMTTAALVVGVLSLTLSWLTPLALLVPRSIPLIFLLLGLVATAGPRFLLRISARSIAWQRASGKEDGARPQPVLIMGAGDAGVMIVREMRNNPRLGLDPIGFLDDNPAKHAVHIHGVPVLGGRETIPALARQYGVKQVIIAMPTASGQAIREILHICSEAGVQTRIVPGIFELLGGRVDVRQLRDVRIEDLLRREPVRTDISAVAAMLRGKRILVTGAGGSIGSELCRQIIRCEPAALVLVGHGENSIFEIHNELKVEGARFNLQPATCNLHPVIADIRFADRVCAIFQAYRPEIVFHAAAHKHVPLMESNTVEAITNNVLGTRNLIEAAAAVGTERFVMISTDKAVNPTSMMGASKRVAELVVTRAGRERENGSAGGSACIPDGLLSDCSSAPPSPRASAPLPLCSVVRFGNVLGSRGSVVPFFQKQIAAGGPVTITHPEMRRFFMTIPEAAQLVLQAAVLGKGGEVFALDMGEPVRIADLANDLIRLSGFEPGQGIQIVYTGLRPGEKLYEELFAVGETHTRTQHEKIFVCSNGVHGQTADARRQVADRVNALIAAAQRDDACAVRRLLQDLVPEYHPVEVSDGVPELMAS